MVLKRLQYLLESMKKKGAKDGIGCPKIDIFVAEIT